jgi:fructose-bisphosphate aldolase, class II
MSKHKPGVLHGDELIDLFDDAQQNQFALPAINVFNTNSINATLETAASVNSPVIIQLSIDSSQFFSGKGLLNQNLNSNVLGAMSAALHVHTVAKYYGVPVVLHTDHASKEWLPWVDKLITEGEIYKRNNGVPLFSSHMLDLSKEPLDENVQLSVQYFRRLEKLGMGLEIEIGITGGEEGGVDNTNVELRKLYTHPSDIGYAYEMLRGVGKNFTIAAAFGNVHGIYNPDNVNLRPEILKDCQEYIREKFSTGNKPIRLVFHGGSGSPKHQIRTAIEYGVVKVNLDTDLQWAFWNGVRCFYEKNGAYLQGQLGNPQGQDRPNKKYYDAKTWLRAAEETFGNRLREAFEDLNCINRNS